MHSTVHSRNARPTVDPPSIGGMDAESCLIGRKQPAVEPELETNGDGLQVHIGFLIYIKILGCLIGVDHPYGRFRTRLVHDVCGSVDMSGGDFQLMTNNNYSHSDRLGLEVVVQRQTA